MCNIESATEVQICGDDAEQVLGDLVQGDIAWSLVLGFPELVRFQAAERHR